MTLREINERIAKGGFPQVTLYRGEGYHYYVYDKGDVYESETVYVPYLKHQEPSVWVADGIAFGQLHTAPKIGDRMNVGGPFSAGGSRVSQ